MGGGGRRGGGRGGGRRAGIASMRLDVLGRRRALICILSASASFVCLCLWSVCVLYVACCGPAACAAAERCAARIAAMRDTKARPRRLAYGCLLLYLMKDLMALLFLLPPPSLLVITSSPGTSGAQERGGRQGSPEPGRSCNFLVFALVTRGSASRHQVGHATYVCCTACLGRCQGGAASMTRLWLTPGR